jgi:hypothetical protein
LRAPQPRTKGSTVSARSEPRSREPTPRQPPGVRRTRTILIVVGTLVMAYAAFGALTNPDASPVGHLAFLIGVVLAHDAVLLPTAIGVGALIGRFVPAPARVAVRVAAFVSVIVALIATPFVLGYGRMADEPSALPLDYGRGLAVTLGMVWAFAAVAVLTGRLTRCRSRPTPSEPN